MVSSPKSRPNTARQRTVRIGAVIAEVLDKNLEPILPQSWGFQAGSIYHSLTAVSGEEWNGSRQTAQNQPLILS